MGGASRTAATSMLNSVLLQGGLYLALFTGDPTAAGVELSDTGYARQPVTFTQALPGDTGVMTLNIGTIRFGTMMENSTDEIAYWAVYTASTGGNMVWYGAFDTPTGYQAGDTVVIRQGSLYCTIT